MLHFKFNLDKAVATILYISKQGVNDLYTLLKIIYFAEKKHIRKYGMPILGDSFSAMEHGPVPSTTYNIIKYVRGDNSNPFCDCEKDNLKDFFEVKNVKYINPLKDPDVDEFSESDLECLKESIEENRDLGFEKLKEKSHDSAYYKVDENDIMSYEDIAECENTPIELIERLKYLSENEAIFK